MSMILTIHHLSGALNGKSQRVAMQEGQTLRLGRAPENDIKFSDATEDCVSGLHAELRLEGGRLHIEDKKSANGTFVNNASCPPFQKVAVPEGATVRLAKQGPELRMTLAAAPAPQPVKETVGRATMLREIDRVRQEERGVVAGELAQTRKKSGLWLSAGLAAVLLLAAGGIAGAMWWTKQRAEREKTLLTAEQERLRTAYEGVQNRWPEVAKKVSPAVVHVECRYRLRRPFAMDAEGSPAMVEDMGGHVKASGVQIRPGLILTALHAVEPWRFAIEGWDEMVRQNHAFKPEYDLLEIQFPGQQPLKARLVAGSQEQDLALLQVQETVAPSIAFGRANADVKVTEEIAIFGYPGELGEYLVQVENTVVPGGGEVRNVREVVPTFVLGTVARPLDGAEDSGHHLLFDASTAPGSSGGPVVNRAGELVGIVSLQFQRQGELNIMGQVYPTLVPMAAGNVAVTPDDITAFLRKSGIV